MITRSMLADKQSLGRALRKRPQYFLPFYGIFTIKDYGQVEWQPNTQLERSPKDQFKMNLEHGHFDGKILIGEYTVENMK